MGKQNSEEVAKMKPDHNIKDMTMSTERNGYTPWYIEKDFGVIEGWGGLTYKPIYYVPII